MSTGVFSSNGWYNIGLIPGLSIMQILQSIRPDISSNTSQIRIYVANVGTAPPDASSNTFNQGLLVEQHTNFPDGITSDSSDASFFPSTLANNQFDNFFLNNLKAPTGYFNKNLSFNGTSIDLCGNFAQPDDAETFEGADWVEIPSTLWRRPIPTFSSSQLSGSQISIANPPVTTLPIAIGAWIFINNSNSSLNISASLGEGVFSGVLLGSINFDVYRLSKSSYQSSISSTNLKDLFTSTSVGKLDIDYLGRFERSKLYSFYNNDDDILLLSVDQSISTATLVGTTNKAPSLKFEIFH